MPGSGRDRRDKQAARFARWLPALERLAGLRTVTDLEAFIAAEARHERLRHTGRKTRSLADEFRALLNGGLERTETGWKASGRFDHLLTTARTIVSVRGFARQPSHREVPAPPTTSIAAAKPQKEDAMAPAEKTVEQIFRFPMMPSEARKLLTHIFQDEGVPGVVVRARSKLGPKLYDPLKVGDYMVPQGRSGMNTPAKVDQEVFEHTRFVLAPEGTRLFRKNTKRPADLAEGERQHVAPDQFLRDLRTIAGRAQAASAAPEPVAAPVPPPSPAPVAAPIAAPQGPDWLTAHRADLQHQLEEARTARAKLTHELEDLDARRAHVSRELGGAEVRVDVLATELVALSLHTDA